MKKATIKAVASILGGLMVFTVAFFMFQSSPSTTEAMMTKQEAEKIAQDQFQGEIVSVELDDGRYEIEIESDDARYELKLDAETGEIIKLEEKRHRVVKDQANEELNADEQENKKAKEETKEEPKEEEKDNSKQATKEKPKQATKEKPKQESKQETVTEGKKSKQSGKKESTSKKKKENVIISSADAIKIAHNQVNNATVIEIELDSDDGQRYYEIEMQTANQEVEIEIDAYTGKVIMIEFEKLEGSRKGNSDIISMEEAKRIALAKEPNARIVEAELDRDDGRYYYEIEMETSKYEIEIEIDAHTGKITDIEYDD